MRKRILIRCVGPQSNANRPFLDYYVEKMEEKSGSVKNYSVWESAYYHLKNCVNPNLLFDEIDDNFVKRVRDYFEKDARTKSNLPLSQNSKYSYFNKFKACLRSAFDDGYLSINYAGRVKAFAQGTSHVGDRTAIGETFRRYERNQAS